MEPNLRRRTFQRMASTLITLAALLFIPGGLRFWPGWVFFGLMVVLWGYFFVHLLHSNPELLERRMRREETSPEQRRFQRLFPLILLPAIILAGLDFRFGWSRALGFPLMLLIVGQAASVAGYVFVFWVMKTNSFAGTTIQVEENQDVIDRGPYALVRHPMYLGMAVMLLGMPLALGSYVALPLFALIIPLLAFRLIHEEKTLRQDLAGYTEYCQRTRFRLVPGVW